jgi:ribosomal 50S subunit-recycling heat shock protein
MARLGLVQPSRRLAPLLLSWVAVAAACSAPVGVRINKVFTASFSRREADRLVGSGRVRINGACAQPGDRVTTADAVTLDGAPFALPAMEELADEQRHRAEYLCARL